MQSATKNQSTEKVTGRKNTGGVLGRWLLLGTVFAGAGVVVVARRRIFPQQQEIVTSLLPMLRAEPEVRELVGSKLVPGSVTGLKHHYWGRSTAGSVELSMMVRGEVSQVRVGVIAAKRRNSVVLNTVRVELPNREILRL